MFLFWLAFGIFFLILGSALKSAGGYSSNTSSKPVKGSIISDEEHKRNHEAYETLRTNQNKLLNNYALESAVGTIAARMQAKEEYCKANGIPTTAEVCADADRAIKHAQETLDRFEREDLLKKAKEILHSSLKENQML